jgi:hypothetical protein
MPKSHLSFVLVILYMHKKIMRKHFKCNLYHIKIHQKSMGIIEQRSYSSNGHDAVTISVATVTC